MTVPPDLGQIIDAEAARQGHDLGWSFFYCPAARAHTARLATLGLNPGGGRSDGTDWASLRQLEDLQGNSYLWQRWGRNSKKTALQQQIARLIEVAGVSEQEVVSLNAIPFRSPGWASLKNRDEAVEFGLTLCKPVLESPCLQLIVGFGLSAIEVRLVRELGYKTVGEIPTGWGKVQARCYDRGGKTLLMLPHLSRFAVLGRPQAERLEDVIRMAISQ